MTTVASELLKLAQRTNRVAGLVPLNEEELARAPFYGERSAVPMRFPQAEGGKVIPKSLAREQLLMAAKERISKANSPLVDEIGGPGIPTPRVYGHWFRQQVNLPVAQLRRISPEAQLSQVAAHIRSGAPDKLSFITGLDSPGSLSISHSEVAGRPTIALDREYTLKHEQTRKAFPEGFVDELRENPGPPIGHEFEHAMHYTPPKPAYSDRDRVQRTASVETPAVFAEIAHRLATVDPSDEARLRDIRIAPSPHSGTVGETGGGVNALFFKQQAEKHFLNKGKSMAELLGSRIGMQFLERQMGRSKENVESKRVTRGTTINPQEVEKVLAYLRKQSK